MKTNAIPKGVAFLFGILNVCRLHLLGRILQTAETDTQALKQCIVKNMPKMEILPSADGIALFGWLVQFGLQYAFSDWL
ncbi:MAG: hypothetical protein Q4E16_04700 [Neisseria sp.]|nr:hypothetical protein [Neisseria sp.]